jgi:hypothetical protein
VSAVLKTGCDEVYRFRTDNHDGSMLGSHRCSYNELLRKWKAADPKSIADVGSFPHVEKDAYGPQGFLVSCTCMRCSHNIPVQLWCETYDFKSTATSNAIVSPHVQNVQLHVCLLTKIDHRPQVFLQWSGMGCYTW